MILKLSLPIIFALSKGNRLMEGLQKASSNQMNDEMFSTHVPDESAGFLLWQVTNLWQREIKKALQPFSLTHSQFVLLASIFWFTKQQQEITQITLSQHTKVDPMTTSTVLRTLQSKCYIDRKEHKTDTRAKLIILTTKGEAIIIQAIKSVEKFDETFFGNLDKGLPDFNYKLRSILKSGSSLKESEPINLS